MFGKLFNLYDRNYKKLMIMPLMILTFSISVIIYTKVTTGEFFYKDISLKGGTSITIYTDKLYDINELTQWAQGLWGSDSSIINIIDPLTGAIVGYEFRTGRELVHDEVLGIFSEKLGLELTNNEFSMGVQSATIASNFFTDSIIIILISFALMAGVTLYYFKEVVPGITILVSVVCDLINIIAVLNLLKHPLSVASMGALLMIIAYSTDSDIVLSSNLIKNKEGDLQHRLKKALKTKATMIAAALTTYSIMFLLTNVELIKSISLVLLIGAVSDVFNTFILTSGLQRIYLERKK